MRDTTESTGSPVQKRQAQYTVQKLSTTKQTRLRAKPLTRRRERHRTRDAQPSKTRAIRQRRDREQRRHKHRNRAEHVKVEQQPAVRHPERVPHLRRRVDLHVQVVQETLLRGERAHGDDALQQLAEVGEDGRACVGLHAPQVTPGVEVSYGQLAVSKAYE